jgi:hypothetical protein
VHEGVLLDRNLERTGELVSVCNLLDGTIPAGLKVLCTRWDSFYFAACDEPARWSE